MGIFWKVLGVGLTVIGIKKIREDIEEENRRKNSICRFDGNIAKESFYVMVTHSGKGIKRITNLYANGPIVYGTVRSQSGLSHWHFKIDFNDYGNITGRYWLSTDNNDSDIPKTVANRISQMIADHLNCTDNSFDETLSQDEADDDVHTPAKIYCPYCGKPIDNVDAKFCMFCGMRFRV